MQKVEVGLGDRAYDILIRSGLLDKAGRILHERFGHRRVITITDENVAESQWPRLKASLEKEGFATDCVTLPAGEATKSYAHLTQVCDAILDHKIERGDLIIALGGGVIGDLAGFAASIVRRGIRYIQIPTSLLAQVDSSVGGKTAINTKHGKNLVGAFYQPSLVLIDPSVLNTLSERHMKAGYAEVLKYALISDGNFYFWLEEHAHKIAEDGRERARAIANSCRHKAHIVQLDEKENNIRAVLNLGHTFGHALEQLTGYSDRLVHGEAVSIGMVMALKYSNRLGLCDGQDITRVTQHLEHMGLPTSINAIQGKLGTADDMLAAMYQDKKVKDGVLTLILAEGIGRSFVKSDADGEDVRGFLTEEFAARDNAVTG